MYERANPNHPDKVADRIAGALVDLAYEREENPRVAVEVMIGHGMCYVIAESSVTFTHDDVQPIVDRIAGDGAVDKNHLRLLCVPQDKHLSDNQQGGIKAADNGIFRGEPVSEEELTLIHYAYWLYRMYPYDGKMVMTDDRFVICQSHVSKKQADMIKVKTMTALGKSTVEVNPLGPWTGGLEVDSGATNRKLGSDMGRAVTGGGLHGKDLSKADVSVNIMCHLLAQLTNVSVHASCAIGDEHVTFYNDLGVEICTKDYAEVVSQARSYIGNIGGFERLAEWGLIR